MEDIQRLIQHIIQILVKNKDKFNVYEMNDASIVSLSKAISAKLNVLLEDYVKNWLKDKRREDFQ